MKKDYLQPGMILKGKWNGNQYKIISKLGQGGVGQVYLVEERYTKNRAALKISDNIQSITKEYEKLAYFEELKFTPKVNEIDDCEIQGKVHYYFSMEYIQGKNMKDYIQNRPISWKCAIGIILIIGNAFKNFHRKGYIFGDLKLENLMIDSKRIKIIDLGGATKLGSSVKEFTPFYDRASWNMGLRTGNEEYDLFSLNLLLIYLLLREDALACQYDICKLMEDLKKSNIPMVLQKLIRQGIMQKDISFEEYYIQLKKIYEKNKLYLLPKQVSYRDKWINFFFVSSVVIFLYVLWIF
ncbi:MAG: protein kinase [Thermotaleaceae bacterium]